MRASGRATAVFFRYGDLARPVLLIEERQRDVHIYIRSERDEHLSLHRERDGTVLLTHWSPDKPPSVWDDTRIAVARAVGIRDPERHGRYYQHRPLVPGGFINGDEMLVGKRVDIADAPARAKYERASRLEIAATAQQFMVRIYISATLPTPDERHVATAFGNLYFRLQP
jgi:hypothetical protein